jgi:hypothetical protein
MKSEMDLFEKVQTQLEAFHNEITVLAKRSMNDAINVFKLKFINATITEANGLLSGKYRPFPDFNLFNVDDLPSNSDVTFILAQYLNCMEKYRSDNIRKGLESWYWKIDDSKESAQTAPPQKLSKGR